MDRLIAKQENWRGRIWSEAELLCRELAIESISQSKIIGNFN